MLKPVAVAADVTCPAALLAPVPDPEADCTVAEVAGAATRRNPTPTWPDAFGPVPSPQATRSTAVAKRTSDDNEGIHFMRRSPYQ
jgi:hypothetical protein